MDTPHELGGQESAREDIVVGFEAIEMFDASPLDPTDALNLHRAINERRAQVENPELLKRLRSL